MSSFALHRPHVRRRDMGFTLIELLVVIAVITLLAALVMPSMMQAVAMAERTRCSSNMGQILRGCAIYANQFKRYFPNGKPARTGYGDDDLSRLVTGKYVGDIKVFACPATEDDPETPEDIRYKATNGGKMSYEYRGQYNPRLAMPGFNLTVACVMTDEDGYHVNGIVDGDNHGTSGANMAFMDSHVEWQQPDTYVTVYARSRAEWAR